MKALMRILPTPATVAGLFALPLLLTGYFVFARYSDKLSTSDQLSYTDYQADFLSNFLLNQAWVNWFNELLDFAIWGVVAAVILVAIWAASAAKLTIENHYTQQNFLNFNYDKTSWHGKFWTVLCIRLLLIGVVGYSVVTILVRVIPELAQNVEKMVQTFTIYSLEITILTILKLVFFQYMIAVAVSVFHHLNSE